MCLSVLCVVTKVFAQLQSNVRCSRVASRRPSIASLSARHMRHGLLATRATKARCRWRFSVCWSPERPGRRTEEDEYPGNLNIYNFIISEWVEYTRISVNVDKLLSTRARRGWGRITSHTRGRLLEPKWVRLSIKSVRGCAPESIYLIQHEMSALITASRVLVRLKYLSTSFMCGRAEDESKAYPLDLTTNKEKINVYFILLMNF